MSNEDDLDARLAAAQAKLEAADAKREAAREAAAKQRRVEQIELEAADAEAINRAEEELGVGKFAVIRTNAGAVIVKRPHPMHYRKFINLDKPTSDDATRLVITALYYPSRPVFDALIDELPAVPMLAATALVDLAAGRSVSGKS